MKVTLAKGTEVQNEKLVLAVLGVVVAVGLAAWATGRNAGAQSTAPGLKQVPVTFEGGHDIDRRDGGRPVVLVASALGVTPEKFREAFSGVTPARGGPPEATQVRRNKEALMRVLAPLGVTNDRLDEVSNFYRYRPESGELWKHRQAKAYAMIKEGAVIGFDIADAGAGYSTAPTIRIGGMPTVKVVATISFSTDLQKNGSVAALALEGAATQPAK